MMWMIDVISKIEYYFCSLLFPSTGIHSQETRVVSFVRFCEDIHKTPSQTPYQAFFGFFRERTKKGSKQ